MTDGLVSSFCCHAVATDACCVEMSSSDEHCVVFGIKYIELEQLNPLTHQFDFHLQFEIDSCFLSRYPFHRLAALTNKHDSIDRV